MSERGPSVNPDRVVAPSLTRATADVITVTLLYFDAQVHDVACARHLECRQWSASVVACTYTEIPMPCPHDPSSIPANVSSTSAAEVTATCDINPKEPRQVADHRLG